MTPTQKARDAAIFADAVGFALLAASSPGTHRDESRALLVKAFAAWPSLCRRMSELAELAPNCAVEGQLEADRILEIAEREQGSAVASLRGRGTTASPASTTEGH